MKRIIPQYWRATSYGVKVLLSEKLKTDRYKKTLGFFLSLPYNKSIEDASSLESGLYIYT